MESYLKRKFVFLLVRKRNVLRHHLSQVVLHKVHGQGEALFDLVSGCSVIVVAALLDGKLISGILLLPDDSTSQLKLTRRWRSVRESRTRDVHI